MVSFRVSLGFGLVCTTPLGKNIVGSFFWSYPLLFLFFIFIFVISALHTEHWLYSLYLGIFYHKIGHKASVYV